MKSRIFWILIIATGAVLLLGAMLWPNLSPKAEKLPVLGEVADFTLYDTDGNPVSLVHLEGKIWVADFIFTTCSSICPVMTRHMAVLHDRYQDEERLRLVSISVNPEYDTPEVLAEFAERYQADPETWFFLTGPREDIQDLAVHSFKIGSVEEPVFHSGYFVLVDGNARIRAYYDGMEKKNIRLIERDIDALLAEITP
jgi:protein SCO1/2